MYIMCVYLFSVLSRKVGALQISIIIIIWWFCHYIQNSFDEMLTKEWFPFVTLES